MMNADAVIVSEESFRAGDPGEIVRSNMSFVNALWNEYFRLDELARDSVRSYYVDYYLAQVNNGGFSQFVYNSRWSANIVE